MAHIALSVPDISSHCFQQHQLQPQTPVSQVIPEGPTIINKDVNATNSSSDPQSTGLALPNHSKANGGWFNGLLGCLRPVWTIIGKATAHDLKHNNHSSEFTSFFISGLACGFRKEMIFIFLFYTVLLLYRRRLGYTF